MRVFIIKCQDTMIKVSKTRLKPLRRIYLQVDGYSLRIKPSLVRGRVQSGEATEQVERGEATEKVGSVMKASGCMVWHVRVGKRGTWASCEDPRCHTLIFFIFYFYFYFILFYFILSV